MINDNVTSLWKVSFTVSWEFALGLVSSNISINYQKVELNCAEMEFTDSIKQGGVVSTSWVREFTQTQLEQLGTWAENKTSFCRVLVCILVPTGQSGFAPRNRFLLAEYCKCCIEDTVLKWYDQGQRQSWCESQDFIAPMERAFGFNSGSDTAWQVWIFHCLVLSFILHLIRDQVLQDKYHPIHWIWTVLQML